MQRRNKETGCNNDAQGLYKAPSENEGEVRVIMEEMGGLGGGRGGG